MFLQRLSCYGPQQVCKTRLVSQPKYREYISDTKRQFHKKHLFSSDKNSGPLLLEPDKDNYHEIWNAGDKPAVFLDILAPPYTNQEESEDTNTDQPSNKEQRHCDFYKIARPMHRAPNPDKISHNLSPGRDEVEKKCFWLQVVPTPSDYNCDFEPYLGPPLVLPS